MKLFSEDNADDMESTITSLSDNSSSASQSITSFHNSSFMSSAPSMLLTVTTPEVKKVKFQLYHFDMNDLCHIVFLQNSGFICFNYYV